MIDRQNSSERGSDSMSGRIVAPVVVRPPDSVGRALSGDPLGADGSGKPSSGGGANHLHCAECRRGGRGAGVAWRALVPFVERPGDYRGQRPSRDVGPDGTRPGRARSRTSGGRRSGINDQVECFCGGFVRRKKVRLRSARRQQSPAGQTQLGRHNRVSLNPSGSGDGVSSSTSLPDPEAVFP